MLSLDCLRIRLHNLFQFTFNLLSIGLPWFYDPDRGFSRLTRVDLVIFLVIF
jgi:hypothetical protein